MLRQIKHGEVIIREIKELPQNIKNVEVKNDYVIVGESETHGNDHRVAVKDRLQVEFYEDENGNLFMKNIAPTTVYCPKREKHATVVIPDSTWEIKKMLEWDYANMQEREVID